MLSADQIEADVIAEYDARGLPPSRRGEHTLIIGHSAAGKTSALRRLTQNSKYQHIYDPALLSTARFDHYTSQLFTLGDAAAYFPYEVEAGLVRFLQNYQATPLDLCDQGVESIWAYARALLLDRRIDVPRYQTFFALATTLRRMAPVPRLVVRLRCDSKEARRRVESRGRPHELVALSSDFISQLDDAYSHVLASFGPGVETATLDTTTLTEEETAAQLSFVLNAHPS